MISEIVKTVPWFQFLPMTQLISHNEQMSLSICRALGSKVQGGKAIGYWFLIQSIIITISQQFNGLFLISKIIKYNEAVHKTDTI